MSTVPQKNNCQCCTGIDTETPQRINNSPGQPAISYRIGRHSNFIESIYARLSSTDYPALASLTTRESNDFTLALTDALAGSLDVLTFYTERFANEHYLRTATERMSVQELSRLTGYELAPGVAASTHLAFTLQSTPGMPDKAVEIPIGTRVQSVPAQDEQAQTFETVNAVPARSGWNAIPVQTSTPWRPQSGDTELWLDGLATQLEPGDAILIVGADRMDHPENEHWDVRVLADVKPDNVNNRTRILWDHPLGSSFPPMSPAAVGVLVYVFRQRTALFGHNAPDPNLMNQGDPPSSNINKLIDTGPDIWEWIDFKIDPNAIDLDTDNPKITAGGWFSLVSNQPHLGSAALPGYTELYRADKVIHCSRRDFALSGKITRITPDTQENLTASRFPLERTLVLAQSEQLTTVNTPLFHPVYGDRLTLGLCVTDFVPGQPIALSGLRQRIAIAPRATGLELKIKGVPPVDLHEGDELFLLGPVAQLSGSIPVYLNVETFTALIGREKVRLRLMDRDGRIGTLIAWGNQIRLAPGHEDDPLVCEIAFIAKTNDSITFDRDHTHLKLQTPLQQVYERTSLYINANVTPASHGETVKAILGSGDAGRPDQRFYLGQAPLTFVSADTPSGRASTLEVRANDVLWTEIPTLHAAPQNARLYEITQNNDAITTVYFGDGKKGARLPTGESNVRVRYRKGLGIAGNVAAGQLTTLLSRPLGVSGATNPAPATGGENAETLERARDNAPLTVLTLERAVSILDYSNFARAFAGIDKAHAQWMPAGPTRGVFLTIAGVEGADVPVTSDTFRNLRDALISYGDPLVPLRMVNYTDVRFRCRLSIKVLSGFEGNLVFEAVKTDLRDHFAFAHRCFGQPVSVDEVAAVAQNIKGVEAVHISRLYREGSLPDFVPRLFAALPKASLTTLPQAAELLTLTDKPIELEVLP